MARARHIPRVHLPEPLAVGQRVPLPDDKRHHLATVLRLRAGDPLILFNDTDCEFTATLVHADRKRAEIEITAAETPGRESPLDVTLVQAIARGDRMDFALAKAVELGVTRIQPVFTARGQVKLAGERLAKKQVHWQRVVVSAAEQSGRLVCPCVDTAADLAEVLDLPMHVERALMLAPDAGQPLSAHGRCTRAALLIGPESGLADDEIVRAAAAGWQGITLGPRVLRTETAGMAALAALQTQWGDLVV
ncbi:16S rRNA (uracil(1498)-N(3))-methyltransferase [Salinisphaera sp. Q1T1-3]|uniref:16S rRNA (uracil(1498)-N(3))-methyltransferase n=1 Tax=Salinisphaera sp. Q1T1-3 TaxID=2321229 RepID=UPI000E72EED8|nr:16S rRNA (uracil(1498)-N(3))-methyltransferase [Salinisphaera sp. Q1T1-3]RJS92383.1 16S rRNA (uracil(1498)-N(3))-methyltransferase [Salinisphaera sp. Q1T1-3]